MSVAFNPGPFADAVLDTIEFRGEKTVVISADRAKEFFQHCRDVLGYDYLIDISSVDNFGSDPRWEMVYELYTLANGNSDHLRVKYTLSEDEKAPTVCDLWPTANWHEREVYDMMGIEFEGHPDLRRILMWDGYPFYPLRVHVGRYRRVPCYQRCDVSLQWWSAPNHLELYYSELCPALHN